MNRKIKHNCYIDRTIKSVGVYLAEVNRLAPEQPDKEKMTDEEVDALLRKQKQEEYDLWEQMRAGSMKARDELIRRNLRYVVTVANTYLWSGVALEDLYMAGNIGLIRAVDRFDASLGNKFISYATWYVECEIKKTVTEFLSHGIFASTDTNIDLLRARLNYYCDWDTRYRDALEALKQRLDKRRFKGTGRLLSDYIEMMQSGLTTTDFMKKHRLTNRQMDYFLEMVREEAQKVLFAA